VIAGVPSIACSLALDWDDPRPDFESAAAWCKPVVDSVRRRGLPDGVLLNVNIPRDPSGIRGYRLATMSLAPPAVARYDLVREDSEARWYRSQWRPPVKAEDGSDTRVLHDGWVAIAPLGLDQTSHAALLSVRQLEAELAPADPMAAAGAN
jgi:5'-nucleotidase